jgi:hypothetical protein
LLLKTCCLMVVYHSFILNSILFLKNDKKKHLVQLYFQWEFNLQPKKIIVISMIITQCTIKCLCIIWYYFHDLKTNWKFWWWKLFIMFVSLYVQNFMDKISLKLFFVVILLNYNVVISFCYLKNVFKFTIELFMCTNFTT